MADNVESGLDIVVSGSAGIERRQLQKIDFLYLVALTFIGQKCPARTLTEMLLINFGERIQLVLCQIVWQEVQDVFRIHQRPRQLLEFQQL